MTEVSLDAKVAGPECVALSLLLVTTSSLAMRAVNERSVSSKLNNRNKGFLFYEYEEIY